MKNPPRHKSPLVRSITELPPFRLTSCSPHQAGNFPPTQILNSPMDGLSLSWSSPSGEEGPEFCFMSLLFPRCVHQSSLPFFVGSQAWFEQNKATASAMVSVWCTIPWGSQNQPWLRSPVVGICLGLSLRIYNM